MSRQRAALARLRRARRELIDAICVAEARCADATARVSDAIALIDANCAPNCARPAGVQDPVLPVLAADQVVGRADTMVGKNRKTDQSQFYLPLPTAKVLVSPLPDPGLCMQQDPDCARCTQVSPRSEGHARGHATHEVALAPKSDRSAPALLHSMDRDRLLTIAEAAEVAGVSIDTIHRRVRQRRFPGARRVPRQGSRAEPPWMIPAGDLIADGYVLQPLGVASDPVVRLEKELVELRIALASAEARAEAAEHTASVLVS